MIYADYNGSAPICEHVKAYLLQRLENNGPYSNPNAIHYLGAKCLRGMEKARKTCAEVLGAKPEQLIFNSGSSEGISQIFDSAMKIAKEQNKKVILMSEMEHSASIECAKFHEKNGFQIVWIPTLANGQIDLKFIDHYLPIHKKEIALVVVMAVNNETGVIQPYKEIARLSVDCGVLYFSDTTQLIGKGEFNFDDSKISYATCSGHKLGALTGTGLLLVQDPSTLKPLIFGGGQEKGIRGGTQNYIGNETLAVALKYFQEKKHNLSELSVFRESFEKKLKNALPKLVIMGENSPRVANTTFLSYPGVHGQAVQIELESQDVFVTTSSACSDNEPVTSKVLKAMKVTDEVGRGAVRISLGLCSSQEDFEKVSEAVIKAYYKLLKIKSY